VLGDKAMVRPAFPVAMDCYKVKEKKNEEKKIWGKRWMGY
jgi:hypothetical protein